MSKADDFREWVDRVFEPPEADYVIGRCKECGEEVWISTAHRPHGMAESCNEHWPLCEFTPGDGL